MTENPGNAPFREADPVADPEAADGLPPRTPASQQRRRGQHAWTVARVRQGLARRLPPLRRFMD